MARDLISRDALIDELEDWYKSLGGTMNQRDWIIQDVILSAMDTVNEAPAVDAEPVRHGEWVSTEINHREGTQRTSCTVCGFSYYGMALNHFKRCPDCGSKMKEALTDDA